MGGGPKVGATELKMERGFEARFLKHEVTSSVFQEGNKQQLVCRVCFHVSGRIKRVQGWEKDRAIYHRGIQGQADLTGFVFGTSGFINVYVTE